MKSIVIYYSLEGNTHFIASEIAKKTGSDVLRLKQVKDYKMFSGINFLLFSVAIGEGREKFFKNLEKMLEGNKVLGKIHFLEPLRKEMERSIQKAVDWAEEIFVKAGDN